ncbi:MAG: hypothetical protein CMK07_06425 [Ponticaulis sp.]|nr:hypothetical protein [Ponticaulis sp.]
MDTPETVLIFGATGQDGAYLTQILSERKCRLIGTCQNTSTSDIWRLDYLGVRDAISLETCVLADAEQIGDIIRRHQPDKVFNLAGVTSLGEADADAMATRQINRDAVGVMMDTLFSEQPQARFFQASSAQVFGKPDIVPQTELTPINPLNVYAQAKVEADNLVENARDDGYFAVSGLLYNHESPLRTSRFVSRKIVSGIVGLLEPNAEPFRIGSLNSVRDWSFARDIMLAADLSLRAQQPNSYILASGQAHTVRDWVEIALQEVGFVFHWQGEGLDERAVCGRTGRTLVGIDPRFYRTDDPATLIGDASRARSELNWKPEFSFDELVKHMVAAELQRSGRS